MVQDVVEGVLDHRQLPAIYFYVKILDIEKKGQILLRKGHYFSPTGIPKKWSKTQL